MLQQNGSVAPVVDTKWDSKEDAILKIQSFLDSQRRAIQHLNATNEKKICALLSKEKISVQ